MISPQTWHYGLIAEWWAEFATEGPEIEYFRTFVEHGQPALDAGCGTGLSSVTMEGAASVEGVAQKPRPTPKSVNPTKAANMYWPAKRYVKVVCKDVCC